MASRQRQRRPSGPKEDNSTGQKKMLCHAFWTGPVAVQNSQPSRTGPGRKGAGTDQKVLVQKPKLVFQQAMRHVLRTARERTRLCTRVSTRHPSYHDEFPSYHDDKLLLLSFNRRIFVLKHLGTRGPPPRDGTCTCDLRFFIVMVTRQFRNKKSRTCIKFD